MARPSPYTSSTQALADAEAPPGWGPRGGGGEREGGWTRSLGAQSEATRSGGTPSWIGGSNPYTPNSCSLGPDFYLSFPYPWNAVPQARGTSANDILKITTGNLPKFNGNRASYLAWRSTFIPCVHLTTVEVSFKVMLLRSCMSTNTPRMEEFAHSIVSTAEGYRRAVITLEERYGGEESLLLLRQDALTELPILREGDFRNIETFHGRLGTLLLEWAAFQGNDLSRGEAHTFFARLMSRIELTFGLKYLDWLRAFHREKGLRSLHEWLGLRLADHRTAQQYVQSRPTAGGARSWPRPQSKDYEAARGAAGAPPSHLDRNFKKDRAFVQTLEDSESSPDEEVFVAAEAPKNGCPLCTEKHPLGKCPRFQAMTPRERRDCLTQNRRCFLCFQRNHGVKFCRHTFRCAKCKRKHHTMLHEEEAATLLALDEGEEAVDDEEAAEETLEFGLLARETSLKKTCRVSLRSVPVWVENVRTGKGRVVNALLDDGSTSFCLASEDLAKELGLRGPLEKRRVEGVGGQVLDCHTFFAPVRIGDISGEFNRTIVAQVLGKPAGSYTPVDWSVLRQQHSNFKNIPFRPPVQGRGVDLLIGNAYPHLMSCLEEIRTTEEGPIARRTPLGWTATGPVPVSPGAEAPDTRPAPMASPVEQQQALCFLTKEDHLADKQLSRLVKRMFEVEDPGEEEVFSPKEQYAIHYLRQNLRKIGSRYQAPCIWNPSGTRPRNNYTQAKGRLLNLEKSRAFNDPQVRACYDRVIQDWKREGFVRVVPHTEDDAKHFLAHFPIFKESSSTPVRPVMDGKVELNKYVLAGPNLLNDVVDVLMRFRSGLVAYSGDVKQMFLKILLTPEDRPYHCFLWRDPSGQIQVHQFQVHVFGNAGSPFVAVFVVKEHAQKYKQQYPHAVEALVHSTLIDDVLDSADTVEDAASRLLQVKEILATAGMELAKCHASRPEVLAQLPRSAVAEGVLDLASTCNKPEDLGGVKALGVAFDPRVDALYFRMDVTPPKRWTRRWILKTFPRLFDPMGLLLPYTITARIVFSLLTKASHGWDSPLPPNERWERWLSELPSLPNITFPRCVKDFVPDRAELHVFADASSEAYAAVVYLRTTHADGGVVS
jgi:hypothetical protein